VSFEFAAHSGGAVDGPDRGPIPDPWQVDFKSNQMFASFSRKANIPHSEQLMVNENKTLSILQMRQNIFE
jgi:hypothetical protein